jgi:hypothetical protein
MCVILITHPEPHIRTSPCRPKFCHFRIARLGVVVFAHGSCGQEPVKTDEGVFVCPGWGFLHVPGNCGNCTVQNQPRPLCRPPGPGSPLQKPTNPPHSLPHPLPHSLPTTCSTKSPRQGYHWGSHQGAHQGSPTKAPTKALPPGPFHLGSPTKAPTRAPTKAPTKAPANAPTNGAWCSCEARQCQGPCQGRSNQGGSNQ